MQNKYLLVYVLGGLSFTINDDNNRISIFEFKQIMTTKDFIKFERQVDSFLRTSTGNFILNNLEHSYVVENGKLAINITQ